MAKDDFFVIAYKILTHLYACVKAGEAVSTEYLQPGTRDFPITEAYWNFILGELLEKGYVKRVYPVAAAGRLTPEYRYSEMQITADGIQYLQENSMMAKIRNGIREGLSLIPKI